MFRGEEKLLVQKLIAGDDFAFSCNLGNGATRRPLMIDRLTWYEDWPMIEYAEPSIIKQEIPVVNSLLLIFLN
jgi:hypothetical protein